MRRLLVVPDWLSTAEVSLVEGLPALSELAERGTVRRIEPERDQVTPECAYLGLDPTLFPIAQGPLTIAGLGADPPERSAHFHLTLLTLEGETARPFDLDVAEDELRVVLDAAKRLNTSKLTLVEGDGVDHGLVWEDGSLDLNTHEPRASLPYKTSLPSGQGDVLLRRFVDDSVNLLEDLELNARRRDEALPPINCLWPWGQGFRLPMPNLALRRGEPVWVESRSLRLAGLSTLAGYRHGNRRGFGRGTAVRLSALAARVEPSLIIVIQEIAEFRGKGMLDEAAWLTREIDRVLVAPWVSTDQALDVAILAPGSSGGLALRYSRARPDENAIPFDERAMEDSRTPVEPLWRLADEFLSS